MRRKLLLLALPIAVAGLVSPAFAAGGSVTEANLGASWHVADTRAPGSMAFTTVSGRSAVQLATEDGNPDTGAADENKAKVQLLTSDLTGTPISQITDLSYTSWRDSTSSATSFIAGMPAINLVVDTGVKDGKGDTYLVFEPYVDQGNDAVKTDTWQSWDAIRAGQAKWWISGAVGCGQSNACTWQQVLEILPGAVLADFSHPTNGTTFQGNLGLNLGSYNHGLITAVDSLTVNGSNYDFGPRVFDKVDCKNGGFATMADKAGKAFLNQGDCVSYYASSGKTHG